MHKIDRLDIVRSMMGRDKDRLMAVISIVDTQYVQIADGDLRKIGKPKLKKVKHLRYEGITISEITTDKALREQISEIHSRRKEKLGKK